MRLTSRLACAGQGWYWTCEQADLQRELPESFEPIERGATSARQLRQSGRTTRAIQGRLRMDWTQEQATRQIAGRCGSYFYQNAEVPSRINCVVGLVPAAALESG
jgi:hypothetical protein